MRYKRRYILLRLYDELNSEEFEEILIKTFCELFGKISFSMSGFKLFHYDNKHKVAVIRFYHNYIDEYRAAIFYLNKDGKKIQARCVLASGTYRRIKERIKSF
jgi:RNase P/RNase MRP subunit POP5